MFEIPRCNIFKSSFSNWLYLCLYHVCLFVSVLTFPLHFSVNSHISNVQRFHSWAAFQAVPGSAEDTLSEDTDSCWEIRWRWRCHSFVFQQSKPRAGMGAWGPEQQYSGSDSGGFTGTSGWESWACPETTVQRQGMDSYFCFCSIPEWGLFIQKITLMQQLVDVATWPTEFTRSCLSIILRFQDGSCCTK